MRRGRAPLWVGGAQFASQVVHRTHTHTHTSRTPFPLLCHQHVFRCAPQCCAGMSVLNCAPRSGDDPAATEPHRPPQPQGMPAALNAWQAAGMLNRHCCALQGVEMLWGPEERGTGEEDLGIDRHDGFANSANGLMEFSASGALLAVGDRDSVIVANTETCVQAWPHGCVALGAHSPALAFTQRRGGAAAGASRHQRRRVLAAGRVPVDLAAKQRAHWCAGMPTTRTCAHWFAA